LTLAQRIEETFFAPAPVVAGVVLAQPIGRKRSFAAGLLLTVVTFGVYIVYWNYKAHNEVYRQFELARENRDEGMVWYVLGLVVPPFLLAYFYVMAANVTYVRDRIGLPRRQTPARFVTLIGLAAAAFVAGLLIAEVALSTLPEDATQEQISDAFSAVMAQFFGFLIAALVLLLIAYYGMQRDINELWDAYAARVHYLRANPPQAPPPAYPMPWGQPAPAGPLLSGPRYYADLGAAGPAASASAPLPGLRERWADFRAGHPDLAETPAMDALLARADADPGAHAEAEARLQQLAVALRERGQVLRRREAVLAAMEELEGRAAQGLVAAESYDAERGVLEREWEALRAQLDLVDARVSRLA
jgi:uncharacterized membrane protein (DUF485 family)